ncbi:MAG: type II toxin-antitoxin system Phd/YefM family antitoxin [Candidatus Binatia bacterium]
MSTVSVTDLKRHLSRYLRLVTSGESVEVLRRNVPVALLSPPKRASQVRRPDFAARLKTIYGTTVLATSGTELVSEARGDS